MEEVLAGARNLEHLLVGTGKYYPEQRKAEDTLFLASCLKECPYVEEERVQGMGRMDEDLGWVEGTRDAAAYEALVLAQDTQSRSASLQKPGLHGMGLLLATQLLSTPLLLYPH